MQGVIWNIYSYEQWGVELGKQLASSILHQIDKGEIKEDLDSSTKSLLQEFFAK